MKVIFECETELGRCDSDRVDGDVDADAGEWLAFAHTSAAMTGAQGMLRIEQHCYLRSTQDVDVRNQNWVRPEMTLEPVLGSQAETLCRVQSLHRNYVQKARDEFLEASVLVAPSLVA